MRHFDYIAVIAVLLRAALGLARTGLLHPGRPAAIDRASGKVVCR